MSSDEEPTGKTPIAPKNPPLIRPRIGDWLKPCLTAFIASFCIMTLELIAGRIVARHLGASLYTWTAVIGVVLGGIAVGNYAGGWIADIFRPRTALACLFFAAAAGALTIPFLNNWVGGWDWKAESPRFLEGGWLMSLGWESLESVPWSLRVFLHVAVVFTLPSTVLGLISPAVAKLALSRGRSPGLRDVRKTGRAVGNVYAWGALGSIFGTFVTGFFLISAFGTIAVVIGVAIVLALVGCLFSSKLVCAAGPPACFLIVYLLFCGPWETPFTLVVGGSTFKILQESDTAVDVEYVGESQYSYIEISRDIEVYEDGTESETLDLRLDNLLHSTIDLEDLDTLQYDYETTYRALVHRALPDPEPTSALFIGGGGFVFPRFLRAHHPGSHIQVAEIDPVVTEASFAAFGLQRNEARVFRRLDEVDMKDDVIWIRNIDARNHVEDLVRKKRADSSVTFSFVFGDAFNDFSVPFHLTTLEFNRLVAELLTPARGIYMINAIDIFDSGKFVGAVINTLEAVFPHVYAFCNTEGGPDESPGARDTFVIAGALRELPVEDLPTEQGPTAFLGSRLSAEDIQTLRERSGGLVLTDDHAPVEQLLKDVINRR